MSQNSTKQSIQQMSPTELDSYLWKIRGKLNEAKLCELTLIEELGRVQKDIYLLMTIQQSILVRQAENSGSIIRIKPTRTSVKTCKEAYSGSKDQITLKKLFQSLSADTQKYIITELVGKDCEVEL
jgi:hypothetical protein